MTIFVGGARLALVLKRISLLGAQFLLVELQAHALNNARVRYIRNNKSIIIERVSHL